MDPALRCGAILLGKYRIDRVLGQGGMGVVLKVTHVELGDELAIKVLLPHGAAQSETHARFMREARSVAKLRGEHVARMIDVGVLPDGSPYMLMEYLQGADLAAELHRRGRLPVGEAVDHALQACAALAEAHANGIVHRDIKPGNLFLTTRLDGSPLIKVLDFGISKDPSADGTQLTQTQTMMGTPGYMSPEHMKATKEVDARTDLWSLGVVLYECLNGRRPFVSDSFSGVVIKVATEEPDAMDPAIPAALQRVVRRCLEKDRNARWASAAELAASLAPFARDAEAAALAVEQARLLGRGPRLRTAPGLDAGEPGRRRLASPTTLSGSAGAANHRPTRAPRGTQWAYGRIAAALGALAVVVGIGLALLLRGGADEPAAPAAPAAKPIAMTAVPPPAPVPPPPPPPVPPPAPAVAPAPATPGPPSPEPPPAEAPSPEPQPQPAEAIATAPVDDKAASPAHPASPCDKIDLGDTMATAANNYAKGGARSALALVIKALDCRHSDNMYRLAGIYACAALDARAALLYYGKTSPQMQPQVAQKCQQVGLDLGLGPEATRPPPPAACRTMNADEVMARAANQFASGHIPAAVTLADSALACQQSGRMYWLATIYACAAGDRPRARQYFRHAPADLQPGLAERCAKQNVNVRGS